MQTKGLALNGDLVIIGTAQDALFEGAKEDIISFGLTWQKNGQANWKFNYNREADVTELAPEELDKDVYK